MQLSAELLRIEPTATLSTLGGLDVYRFQKTVPAFTFDVAVHFTASGNGIVLKDKAGLDYMLAAAILSQSVAMSEAAFGSNEITVLPLTNDSRGSFDTLVFLPPPVAQCFIHQSKTLQSKCAWSFPAFSGEFTTGQLLKDFRRQIGRKDGWRIDVSRWDRRRKTEPSWDL